MSVFKPKNCLMSCLSLGCLGLILFAIFTFNFLSNLDFSFINKPIKLLNNTTPPIETKNEFSHLNKKDKKVLLKLILISDTENQYESLEQIKPFIDGETKALIHMGDITQLGVLTDFQNFKKAISTFNVPTYYVPGDRDLWKSSGITNFNKILGKNYQMVDILGVKFLLIDNANEYEGIDTKQFEFIEANINQADFLVFHNPIYFNSSLLGVIHKGMGQYSTEVEDQRLKLLELARNSNVKGTFSGDQHLFSEITNYDKSSLNHYVIGALNNSRNLDNPNFAILTIYTDKDYTVEKIYLSK